MAIVPVAINRLAAFLVPKASGESAAFLSGFIKVSARFGPGGKAFARETAMFLTRAEQSALFGFGRRALVWFGSRLFLVGAVLDFARNLISPGDERKTVATRLEIIQAHVVKGGPLLTRAIGVAEQLLFLTLDATGETLSDVLAGALANIDEPSTAPPLLATIFDRGAYADLAPPVADLETVDSILEGPGFLLSPAILPFPIGATETFPAGPMPSWGRRS